MQDTLYKPEKAEFAMTAEEAVCWLRSQPGQEALVKACYFDDPLIDAAERFYLSTEWQAISDLLKDRPGLALDLGAGRGIASYALAKDGWTVTSVEPDPSNLVGSGAIRELSEHAKSPITIQGEYGRHLPFPDNRFDVVFVREVLHHLPDLKHGLKEIARVLKAGGRLIVCREHVLSKPEDLPIFLKNHALHHLYGGENAYLLKDYLGAITGAGLRVVRAYAPLDSVINYFPMTEPERLWLCRLELAKFVGAKAADKIIHSKHQFARYLVRAALWKLSNFDPTPGRLYSFLAEKP